MPHHTPWSAIAVCTLVLAAGAAPAALETERTAAPIALQAELDGHTVSHSSSLWSKKKYDVQGLYTVEVRDGGTFLVLGADFKTRSGPDLKLALSPQSVSSVKSKTALTGGLVLGLLSSEKGRQEFRVPDGTDLSRFKSVLIHCEEYTVLWGAAPLSAGEVVAHGDDWTKKTSKVTGAWEIARVGTSEDAGYEIRFADDFKTKKAPDLKIVLSPLSVSAAKNNNALQGGEVVSLLRSNKGAQTFRLSGDVDLSRFRSLLIHCEQYTKLWGAAPLSVAG